MERQRCAWCRNDPLSQKYHDEEWGIPLHDDQKQFEFLMLEVMQCGLSWSLMLKKREIFRRCFAGFDYNIIADFTETDIARILSTEGMIRSERKIRAIIHNAQCFQRIIEEWGSFDQYIWSFTDHETYIYRKHHRGLWETRNALSDHISADLKKRGFQYLGSVTVFSHLQSCGIINDHQSDCWMYAQLIRSSDITFIDD